MLDNSYTIARGDVAEGGLVRGDGDDLDLKSISQCECSASETDEADVRMYEVQGDEHVGVCNRVRGYVRLVTVRVMRAEFSGRECG